MANTSARILRLLSLLQAHRYWAGTELAERLGVSGRTLRRDVDRLRELGYPVVATRGVAGGYQLQGGAALPPLVLDDDEGVAIAVGLRSAAQVAGSGLAEAAVRALTKVVQVLPPRLRRRVEAVDRYTVPTLTTGPAVDPVALATIAQTCRDDERLAFDYPTQDERRSERLVEPHRLVQRGARWYLVAWDLHKGNWRTFRVDRLTDPRGTGARFRQRQLPAADAAEFVRAQFARQPCSYHVVVEIDLPAATLRKDVGEWATIDPIDDARCRLEMTTDSLSWPILILAECGADFRILAPTELAARVEEVATRFTSRSMTTIGGASAS